MPHLTSSKSNLESDRPAKPLARLQNFDDDSDSDAPSNDRASKDKGKQKAASEAELELGSSEDDEEKFPELYLSADEESNDQQDTNSDSDIDDPDVSEYDDSDNDSDNLDTLFSKSRVKPGDFDATPSTTPEAVTVTDYLKKARTVPSKFKSGKQVLEWDEIEAGYGSESSTEDVSNRVGSIPSHFYDDMPHVGYDIDGKKVMRPVKGDELDKFLSGVEDPSSWTSVEDKLLQKDVQLTDHELDIIRRLAKAENPDANFNPYEDLVEFYTGKGKEMPMPLTGNPEPKRRFVPSKWEHKKVIKIVRAIRQGRIVLGPALKSTTTPKFYALWSSTDEARAPGPMHMPAPKLKLPNHEESYNPPAEYLFTDQERKEWEAADPSDRAINFIPQKNASLRQASGYDQFVEERFDRLLDLYLAPRALARRPKLDISDPSELLPKLPSPRELRPFPTMCSLNYEHPVSAGRIRCVSIDPSGWWVATGAEDGIVRVFELTTGVQAWSCVVIEGTGEGETLIHSLEWGSSSDNNMDRCLLAVAVSGKICIISPVDIISPIVFKQTVEFVHSAFTKPAPNTSNAASTQEHAKWIKTSPELTDRGILVEIDIAGTPKQITFHRKGDYLASVSSSPLGTSGKPTPMVLIHQLTTRTSQSPFRRSTKRSGGEIQKVAFHPLKPQFFVATQRFVRCYDFTKGELVKTLSTGLKWISCIDVHPAGDNVVVGSYDKKLAWHDLDLSDQPYKTLRYHQKAIRTVQFHSRLPLLLSGSDDGTIQIFHATVYSDLLTNPLLVPLKVLKGHSIKESLGVLAARWHPHEAWCVTVGADGMGKLWMP